MVNMSLINTHVNFASGKLIVIDRKISIMLKPSLNVSDDLL